jgi:hypothetical protein
MSPYSWFSCQASCYTIEDLQGLMALDVVSVYLQIARLQLRYSSLLSSCHFSMQQAWTTEIPAFLDRDLCVCVGIGLACATPPHFISPYDGTDKIDNEKSDLGHIPIAQVSG